MVHSWKLGPLSPQRRFHRIAVRVSPGPPDKHQDWRHETQYWPSERRLWGFWTRKTRQIELVPKPESAHWATHSGSDAGCGANLAFKGIAFGLAVFSGIICWTPLRVGERCICCRDSVKSRSLSRSSKSPLSTRNPSQIRMFICVNL